MRYEVDIEEYGTLSLEPQEGGNGLLTMRWDGNESDVTFAMSKKEVKQLQKALTFVQIEMEEQA